MRGSLVVLVAGLAGALVSTGCGSKDKASPPPAPATARTPTPPAGAATAGPGAPTGERAVTGGEGAAPVANPGPTEPDPSFELATEQPAAVAVAVAATARLVVHPGPGLHMNLDYPTGLTLTPPDGVSLPKATLAAADVQTLTSKELAFAVPMSAAAQGQYKIPGTFRFAVCDDGGCYPKKRTVELLLTVQ